MSFPFHECARIRCVKNEFQNTVQCLVRNISYKYSFFTCSPCLVCRLQYETLWCSFSYRILQYTIQFYTTVHLNIGLSKGRFLGCKEYCVHVSLKLPENLLCEKFSPCNFLYPLVHYIFLCSYCGSRYNNALSWEQYPGMLR